MNYQYEPVLLTAEQRREFNEKIVCLIDSGGCGPAGITRNDIFNAYTGDGGLHGLERADYDSYHAYSEAKKEVENGQFFTPPPLCEFVAACLMLSDMDLVADLTCGMGNFFNYVPVPANAYGCELDAKAYKVARYLYPEANLTLGDIRTYAPETRFDYVLGNPPYHLRWRLENGTKILSHLYYCLKAADLLKPLGILAVIVPRSFLADDFTDGAAIKQMEERFAFLGQIGLPADLFRTFGVDSFPTKLQFWQRKSAFSAGTSGRYTTECLDMPLPLTQPAKEAEPVYRRYIQAAKTELEQNRSRVLLELARTRATSGTFLYKIRKMLYQIKCHPVTRRRYAGCFAYVQRFFTQRMPEGMDAKEWNHRKLTEAKVMAYLRYALSQQVVRPEQDVIRLVKRKYGFAYKGYSYKMRRQMTPDQRAAVPVYQAVLDNTPEKFPGFERLLRKKRRAYDRQSQPFSEMEEAPAVMEWLDRFQYWDEENEDWVRLNPIQKHDINLQIQKDYGFLQWEQGSGKTAAAIAVGQYRMEHQKAHSTWVVSSAISIRNNWNVVLKGAGIRHVFVERLADFQKVQPGDFVLMTLNKAGQFRKQIPKYLKRIGRKIQFVLDESDNIANPTTRQATSILACFRRCRYKLLTTGTSTRNNISEFAPQLELLYNNSINMISWCTTLYHYSRNSGTVDSYGNSMYGRPIPAYKPGYALFSASHLPEKITVFGVGQRNQDIYNADVLDDILAKTVITRTFAEVTGKELRRIHQMPIPFAPDEREAYQLVLQKFYEVQRRYFLSTGNSRKDAMMRLIQQITLLLRVSAAPDTLEEYIGDTPLKEVAIVELIHKWPNEVVTVGVRHTAVLDCYAEAFRRYLPDRPLFCVTGSSMSFAKRRALRRKLKESGNGILLCTQQSLPSSVNYPFVNKVVIPELHYNNAGMSQFYMRFIRYNSTEYKDIYFPIYLGSLESNLMQMVLAKEKLTQFMKGQNADLDEIYERFGVDYDLLSTLMTREKDEKGCLRIRWGEQQIA